MRLDEAVGTAVFSDSSGNSSDGFCTGSSCPVVGVSGKFGSALSFDGVDDFVDGISIGAARTSDWTISAWVKTTDRSAGVVITNRSVESERSLSLHVGYWARSAQANGLVYFSNDGPQCEWGAVGTTDIADGIWHHIVGVRELLGIYKVYVDGPFKATRINLLVRAVKIPQPIQMLSG